MKAQLQKHAKVQRTFKTLWTANHNYNDSLISLTLYQQFNSNYKHIHFTGHGVTSKDIIMAIQEHCTYGSPLVSNAVLQPKTNVETTKTIDRYTPENTNYRTKCGGCTKNFQQTLNENITSTQPIKSSQNFKTVSINQFTPPLDQVATVSTVVLFDFMCSFLFHDFSIF